VGSRQFHDRDSIAQIYLTVQEGDSSQQELRVWQLIENYVDAGVAKTIGKIADAFSLGVVGLTIADEDFRH
jgi:hypothetical protein